jgi:competence ComEA-like helix-hairpin-helix protein
MRKAIQFDADLPGQPRQVTSMFRWSIVVVAAAVAIFLAFHTAAQTKPTAQPLDLNTATVEQIEQLPGMQKGIAEAIVKFREKSGPFERVEDLRAIRAISKARFEKIRPYVTANPPAHTSG